ncbi:DUF4149 domain-containing protein [Bosea sp. (in: a-proteobacteria)]|uniref:DUF4149 domain-containing protein n=1 Tax=Bosea sp. (in: a-proteobacteria) TaxID=1871050 RepID=UPI002B45B3AD|nr:DUF4149 domain-containing protein [Bosea sp. (in: a-proteobacteria)]WRH60128.1 MAG: DUF4149 domain-containing protein [Bosea sp. (in: a-proteobacteria)]
MQTAGLLAAALLFGGMSLFSFGFAAFLLKALPVELARATIRRAFPHFYLFVIVTAAAAAALLARTDHVAALGLAAVAATTVPTRQLLMSAINRATDAGDKPRFSALHGLSVTITLAHIAAIGWVIVRLSG